MKKRIYREILLFFVCIAALFFLAAAINDRQPSLCDQDFLPSDIWGNAYSLQGIYSEETHHYQLQLYSATPDPSLALVLIRPRNFELFVQGESLLSVSSDQYRRVRSIEIPAKLWVRSGDGYSLSLEWASDNWMLAPSLFLGSSANIARLLSSANFFQAVSIGILIMMILNSLSLYLCKKSEQYLYSFFVYSSLMLLTILINLGLPGNRILSGAYSITSPLFSILIPCGGSAICFYLLNLMPPRPIAWLTKWYGILAVSFFSLILSFADNKWLNETLHVLVLLPGACALIQGVCTKRKHARLLFCGYAVTCGLTIVTIAVNLHLMTEGLIFALWHSLKIFELPFALCCLLTINFRFAEKFREAENLSLELKEVNLSLDRKVEERTQKLIEQQNQRHSLMLNIFHDLRSPLFILKGCTELLPSADPETADIVNVMKDRLAFVSNLTEDLFLAAKLEEGNVVFVFEPVDLSALLKKIIRAETISADEKQIHLLYEIPEQASVWGDSSRLEQAFQNLITNAITYTPKGGTIQIRFVSELPDYVIGIQDSGKGIPPKDLPYIFTKYYRADAESHNSSTGLGLSIAQEIIQKHRGSIQVNSTPGEGSLFAVRLPALDPPSYADGD